MGLVLKGVSVWSEILAEQSVPRVGAISSSATLAEQVAPPQNGDGGGDSASLSPAAHAPVAPSSPSVPQDILRAKENVVFLDLTAESAISLYVRTAGTGKAGKILFEKKSGEPFPIASLTKLMTALIAYENYLPNSVVKIALSISYEFGGPGALPLDAVFSVDELLHMMLIESNNFAAYNLADIMGRAKFINLMNLKAENLGLRNTRFVNPAGLDPAVESDFNRSSARDLSKLAEYIHENEPQIFHMLTLPQYDVLDANGNFYATIKNTDKLLSDTTVPLKIIGGKTGTTDLAGQALLLITISPDNKGFLINVILKSKNRFTDMKKLIEWGVASYTWN